MPKPLTFIYESRHGTVTQRMQESALPSKSGCPICLHVDAHSEIYMEMKELASATSFIIELGGALSRTSTSINCMK